MTLPLILWDVDDVLNDLTRVCVEKVLPAHFPGIGYEMLKHNPPLPELECDREKYTAILDECREQYLCRLTPQKEVVDFFRKYGKLFHSLALSAAPMRYAPVSAEWVLRHFGAWIQGTLYVPSFRKDFTVESVMFKDKGEAVELLNGILVDDSPENVARARKKGGKALLFPAPWNENCNMSKQEFFTLLLKEIGVKNESDQSF